MRILFYYNGAESLAIEELSALLKSNGHIVELLFDPGLGNNHFLKSRLLNSVVSPKKLIKKAQQFRPDIVAFSLVSNQYISDISFARKLRQNINAFFIAGGIHVSSLPELVIKEDCFDAICIGEGDYAFLELADRMQCGKNITKIKNLWVKKDGKVHKNGLRPLVQDLDSLPIPDKGLFAKYGIIQKRIMVMTSRGCPYKCTYCVNSFFDKLYSNHRFLRRKSVTKVINELMYYKKRFSAHSFRFEDDVFSFDVSWLQRFQKEYKKRINLPFHCYITPNTPENIIRLLRDSGCTKVSMGIQSGNEELRKKVLKRIYSNEQVIATANLLKKYRIKLITEFIFGFPGETPKHMWESIKLNDKVGAFNTGSFIFYPFAKTELSDRCLKDGLIKDFSKIEIGEGSYHTNLHIKHDYPDHVYRFNAVMPIYNAVPRFVKVFLRPLFRKKYGFIHRILYILSIIATDIEEVFLRILQFPVLIYKTRKFLK